MDRRSGLGEDRRPAGGCVFCGGVFCGGAVARWSWSSLGTRRRRPQPLATRTRTPHRTRPPHSLTGRRNLGPPVTVRRILVYSAVAQAKVHDRRLAKAREDLNKLTRRRLGAGPVLGHCVGRRDFFSSRETSQASATGPT